MGDDDRELADYSGAIRANPKFQWAFTYRGFAYARRQDYDRALADYNEALRLDPEDADAYIGRACANLYAGALVESLGDFYRAAKFYLKDPAALLEHRRRWRRSYESAESS